MKSFIKTNIINGRFCNISMVKYYKALSLNSFNFQVIILTAVLIITSCKKFVDVPPPETKLVSTNVFTSNGTATGAVTVIYSKLINDSASPYFFPLLAGLSGDELTNYSTEQDLLPFYNNSLNSNNGLVQQYIWSPLYNYIYQSNSAIEGLKTSTTIDPAVKQQLIGEALFIRAFCHFYLVNFFGDIPIITSTDYKSNAISKRSPSNEVYSQIISDLIEAQKDLSVDYLNADSKSVTGERIRPTRWAATALLARVYLYSGDFINAEKQATVVIQNTEKFQLVADLNSVFLENSSEAIWQIKPVVENQNTPEGAYFILTSAPQPNVFNCVTVSNQLLNSFEPGDKRRTNWIGSFDSYNFPAKYKSDASASSTTEYSMILRLAEQYLIRAEARAELGDPLAIDDLNTIRNRAGLSNYSGAADKTSLLNGILHERQVEFFCEWGSRWLDLKRTKSIDAVMDSVTIKKGGNWQSSSQLYPIPQTELLNDPKLTQNPGY